MRAITALIRVAVPSKLIRIAEQEEQQLPIIVACGTALGSMWYSSRCSAELAAVAFDGSR